MFYDMLLNKAIDEVVLSDDGPQPLNVSDGYDSEDFIEYNEMQAYAGTFSPFGSQTEDTNYERKVTKFQFIEASSEEDVIAWIEKELKSLITVVYKSNGNNFAEDLEEVVVSALENFCNSTHVAKIMPNVYLSFDLEEENIVVRTKIKDDRVMMCLFPVKRTAVNATETKYDLDI